jgi:hypothetical protein
MLSRFIWTICAIAFVLGILALTVFNGHSQVGTTDNRSEIDTTHFPITDYTTAGPIDPIVQEKRAGKSKKYNNKYAPPITELSDGMYLVNESLVDLPALLVGKSSAVILGEITKATAHLSEDKTSIYSEFVVQVKAALKNETKQGLNSKSSVEVERYGGRVRLPSGKIIVSSVDHQDLPRVGARYVLFLTGGQDDQDFSILMGYELRAGKVFPLDQTSPTHPISAYKGREESALLRDLSSALTNASSALPKN